MNYLKKMSAAAMNAIPKGYKSMEHGDTIALFDVVGVAENVETGMSQMGEWTAFGGSFQATKVADGEIYRSKKLFLPDVATDAISDAIGAAEGGKVEFALQIGLRRVIKLNAQGEEQGAGYEYTMKPLIEMDEASDPLAGLLAKVSNKALPAPTESEAEAKPGKKK